MARPAPAPAPTLSDRDPARTSGDVRVVLVTGASTGIGLALARRLASSPFRVAATARKSSLDRFAAEGLAETDRFRIRPLDVTKADEQDALIREIVEDWGRLDVLVNNAGACIRSVIEEVTDELELEQLRVNYLAPMQLVRRVLPHMRARRAGHVINVSSVGGMMAMPTMGIYSASKFALEGASEALWYEMRPWGIRVTLVEPGFVHSRAFQRVYWSERGRTALTDPGSAYHSYYVHMNRFIESMMNRALATSDDVAERILEVMEHPDPPLRVPVTLDARAFSLMRRLVPRSFYHWLLYRCLPHVRDWERHVRGGPP